MLGMKPQSVIAYDVDAINEEVQRIETLICEASVQLKESDLDLGTSMRLTMRHREMEAYLQGLRFALGEGPPLSDKL